jgi:hypothetical protein
MFRHHDQENGGKDTGPADDPTAGRAMVWHTELSPADRGRSIVEVHVQYKDGRTREFRQELANLYQPAEGSPEAQRLAELRQAAQYKHAGKVPKIQLPLSDGCVVPLQRDPSDPTGLVIDEAALHAKALNDYIREQKARQAKTTTVASGPPWDVPADCPNCGAPVDQAKASVEPDPQCRFCENPIPVTPRGRSK